MSDPTWRGSDPRGRPSRPVSLSDLGVSAPQRRPPERGQPWMVPVVILTSLLLVVAVWAVVRDDGGSADASGEAPAGEGDGQGGAAGGGGSGEGDGGDGQVVEGGGTTTLPPLPPFDGWVNPASSGRPWGDAVQGLLTFRGNPTRSWYGTGPMPTAPEVLWSFPADGTMCGNSSDGGVTSTWCGSGWTGQPAIWENEADGKTWVAFGAYDYAVHWLDADTGARLLPDFETGDIIKGTVTIDPDGYPLLYTGSRDNEFRIIAMDQATPVELWSINARDVSPTRWNDDWDGSALVIDDYLFEGGENSRFHIVKLNRGYDAAGKVTVDPELVFHTASWDSQLEADFPSGAYSVEGSVAISGDVVYFANSAGLVQGWDISGLKDGVDPTRVFRFWTGDDTDATIAIDAEGFLYVGSEFEKQNARSIEVGQMMKLDPTKPDDPLVWSLPDQGSGVNGVWATPAIWGDVVYWATTHGRLIATDRHSGQVLWEKRLGSQTWQSPVVVDDVLVQGDCEGNLNGYDVSDPTVDPPLLWTVKLDGCIESTPGVWGGRLYVGTRGGKFYAVGDA